MKESTKLSQHIRDQTKKILQLTQTLVCQTHSTKTKYSLRPTQVVKTFLYECPKNIVKVSLLSKENDFSFTTLE